MVEDEDEESGSSRPKAKLLILLLVYYVAMQVYMFSCSSFGLADNLVGHPSIPRVKRNSSGVEMQILLKMLGIILLKGF